MELDISSVTKLGILAAILALFAVAGWRLGAPENFNRTLADAGIERQAPAPAPAMGPATPAAPAQEPAPPAVQPDNSGAGH